MPRFPWKLTPFLLLFACARQGEPLPVLPDLPATFAGKLPCPDCPGIRVSLTLWPDSSFYLQRVRLAGSEDDEQVEVQIGAWAWPGDGRLEMRADGPQPGYRVDAASSRLFPLDAGGQVDPANGRAFLLHGRDLEPLEPRLEIMGMMDRQEGVFHLTECLGGRRFQVIPGGDSPALEQAWDAAAPGEGAQMLATLSVRLGQSPLGEGGRQAVLYIDDFLGLVADEDCPGGEE
jgi:copper homeostasis protein (lipoprotein)